MTTNKDKEYYQFMVQKYEVYSERLKYYVERVFKVCFKSIVQDINEARFDPAVEKQIIGIIENNYNDYKVKIDELNGGKK